MSEFRYGEKCWWISQSDKGSCIIGGPLAKILSNIEGFSLRYIARNNKGLKQWHTRRHSSGSSCGFCLEVEQALSCVHLLEHCDTSFAPEAITRLKSNEAGVIKGYYYQDLMTGTCPQCQKDVLGYIGVNRDEDPIRFEKISEKRYQEWVDRKVNSQRVSAVGIVPGKHSNKKMSVVQGSVYERNSGKYRFVDAIGVE